jgi:RNA polymerase sigma-54 factor
MVGLGPSLSQTHRQAMSQSLRQIQIAAQAQDARFLELSEDHTEAWVGWQLRSNPALRRRSPPPRVREMATGRAAPLDSDAVPFDWSWRNSETLTSKLLEQLRLERTNPRELRAAEAIIENLDRRGFLTVTLEEIAQMVGVEVSDAEDGQAVVMGLDPEGCGALDLHDYLLFKVRSEHRKDRLFHKLVGNYLDEFRAKNYSLIARLEKMPVEKVAEYAELLRDLPPFPAIGFAEDDPTAHVVPTLHVLRDPATGSLRVEALEPPRSRLELNRAFEERALALPAGPEREGAMEQVEQARAVIQQLQGRYNRVLEIAKVAVVEQADFFTGGPERMRNLTMDTVSTKVNMPRPTVSRAVKGRYYLYEGEVRPLRELFTHRSKPGRASQGKLHALIARIVAEEDPRHPLSDAAIVDALRIYGLREARRTVAKHRERAGIPAMAQRRRHVEAG